MTIKVGIYTKYLDELGLTGPSVYLINLIKYLSSNSHIDLYLIHHKKNKNKIYKDVNEILITNKPLLCELSLRRYDLDIIHFNYIPWGYRSFYPLIGFKKIATSHISIGWNERNINPIQRFTEPFSARFLDTIIAVSNDLKKRLLKYLYVPESKIIVIYEGIDHETFKPLDNTSLDRVHSKYALKNPYILHVSNFSMRKNPYTLFNTFCYLVREGFEGELIIIGSGWRNSVSENLIQALGIDGKVRILGRVPMKDLVALYNLAELAFFPSYHENFCFPLVEAMACGTPVVASSVYSIPEVVGNAAILRKPDDHIGFSNDIKSILEDEDLMEQMRRRGLENAKRFSWQKCAKETIEFYNMLLK